LEADTDILESVDSIFETLGFPRYNGNTFTRNANESATWSHCSSPCSLHDGKEFEKLNGSHETNSMTTLEVVGSDTSSSAHSVNGHVEDLVVLSQIPSSSAAAAMAWTSAIT